MKRPFREECVAALPGDLRIEAPPRRFSVGKSLPSTSPPFSTLATGLAGTAIVVFAASGADGVTLGAFGMGAGVAASAAVFPTFDTVGTGAALAIFGAGAGEGALPFFSNAAAGTAPVAFAIEGTAGGTTLGAFGVEVATGVAPVFFAKVVAGGAPALLAGASAGGVPGALLATVLTNGTFDGGALSR